LQRLPACRLNTGGSNADNGPDCVRNYADFNLEGSNGRIEVY
jgi:hypothetical protein